jgi:hypothetical protein
VQALDRRGAQFEGDVRSRPAAGAGLEDTSDTALIREDFVERLHFATVAAVSGDQLRVLLQRLEPWNSKGR